MDDNGVPRQPNDLPNDHVDQSAERAINPLGFTMTYRRLAMVGAAVLALVAVAIAAFVVASRTGDSVGSEPLLQFVPADSSAVNIQQASEILDGAAPEGFRERFETAWRYFDGIGFSVYEVETLVEASDSQNGHRTLVVDGSLEFEAIRDELSGSWGYEDSEYRGFEVWEGRTWEWPVVALFESQGVLLMANHRDSAREVFRILHDGEGSLADTKDSRMRKFLEEMEDGWLVHPVFGDCEAVDRCQALAYALKRRDDDSAGVVAVMLFNSERAAERAADDYDAVYDFLNSRNVYGGALEADVIESRGSVVLAEGVAWFDREGAR